MTRWRFAWWWGCGAVLVLAALPLAAQEEPPEPEPIEVQVLTEEPPTVPPLEVEVVEEPEPSRLQAAVWCPVLSERRREQPAEQPAEGEGGEQGQPAEQVEELRCDVGLGFALFVRQLRSGNAVSLVGVVGAQSLGPGIGWTFARQGGRPLSVAVGIIMPFDGAGIYVEEWAVAVGVTAAVFGRR